MVERIYSLLAAAGVDLLLALAVVPLALRLARRCGMMAVLGSDSQHSKPTAMLGGVSIVMAFLGALALSGSLPSWLLASPAC